MKKYRVNVNGTQYEVEVEEIAGGAPTAQTASVPQAAPVGTGENVKSPMPGTILSVNIKNGDVVKKGQVLMILEAMKMENEIMASRDGRIASLQVSKGATVESGALLCVIE